MIGVVLEGGGTRGAYHVGALKALMEAGYDIGAVTGTSIGAINGAFVASGKFDRLKEIYDHFEPRMIINGSEELYESLSFRDFNLQTLGDLGRVVIDTLFKGGLDITPLKEFLNREIDEEQMRQSPVHFGLVTIDLQERKPKELLLPEIPQGELTEYLLASAYLPYFKSESKRRYLDGGFYNNIPLDLLLRSGDWEHVFIIRTQSIGIHQSLHRDVPTTIIDPSFDLGLTLQFDPEKFQENQQMGYFDTLRRLRHLPGDYYCVEGIPKRYFFDLFKNLSDRKIERLQEFLGLDHKLSGPKLLFEQILPQMERMLGKRVTTYEELGMMLVERLALTLNIDRYHLYGFEDWQDALRNGLKSMEVEEDLDLKDKVNLFLARNLSFQISENDALLQGLGRIIWEEEDETQRDL